VRNGREVDHEAHAVVGDELGIVGGQNMFLLEGQEFIVVVARLLNEFEEDLLEGMEVLQERGAAKSELGELDRLVALGVAVDLRVVDHLGIVTLAANLRRK